MTDAISADGSAISSVDECDKCGRQMRKMQIPDEFGGEPGGSPFCMPCVSVRGPSLRQLPPPARQHPLYPESTDRMHGSPAF